MQHPTEPGASYAVVGKPVIGRGGTLFVCTFGQTSIELTDGRVVERTRRIVSRRHCQLLLKEVDSVELVQQGNALWLVLGILTLVLFGLGLVFIVVYVLVPHRFLLVRSKNNLQVLATRGDPANYEFFLARVLAAADATRRGSSLEQARLAEGHGHGEEISA